MAASKEPATASWTSERSLMKLQARARGVRDFEFVNGTFNGILGNSHSPAHGFLRMAGHTLAL